MKNDLRETWNDVADHWNDWGPPLRPCAQDLSIMRGALEKWLQENPVNRMRVFLCGVTPEIVTMPWPGAIDLTAVDQAESMVRIVWPGDVPGVRRAIVGNWLATGLPTSSFDVVINDGGFGFFNYPTGLRALLKEIRRLLKSGGLFVGRDFAQLQQPESVSQVLNAARSGGISNFHAFKWRLAMALQTSASQGVRQGDVWNAWSEAAIDPTVLPQPGWSERAVGTIHFYRGKEARLQFATIQEFKDLLEEDFDRIEVCHPDYELGERCPILVARPRGDSHE
jgi:SAM-dependent methyltransferase